MVSHYSLNLSPPSLVHSNVHSLGEMGMRDWVWLGGE